MGYGDTVLLKDYISEEWLPGPREDVPGCGKRLGEDLCLSGRERICDAKFSKVNALSRGRSGVKGQEEDCVKFSRAEGNAKVVLVSTFW